MAIPLFVKVRPHVARKMKLDTERFKTADGNYILWQLDFASFGPLSRLAEYAAKVGGVVLRDADAAANYRGDQNTPLPDPTDADWATPENEMEEEINDLVEENAEAAAADERAEDIIAEVTDEEGAAEGEDDE